MSSGLKDGVARRARLARSRLVLELEARPRADDPAPLLDAALRGAVDVVELRGRQLADADLVRAAEPFRRLCDAHGALFVLGGRPELVERAGADGVRVDRSDAPLADARRAAGPDRLLGLSAASAAELDGDPDFFRVGAVFAAPAPEGSVAGGLELVRAARDTLRMPWFAGGGVDLGTIADVVAHGAPGVAVGRAVRDADDPEAAARALRAQLPPADVVVTEGGDVSLPHVDWLPSTRSRGQQPVAPHTHAAHTDVFFLLDGTLEFRLGDGTVRVPSGSAVAAPPLLVHGFRNPGEDDARYLNLHAPGVWARGQRAGLPREQHDQFGPDRATKDARPIAVGPGDGDRLTKPHRLALVKVDTPQIAVLEYAVGVGYDGAEAHVHLRHTDCFYVLDGTLEFDAGGRHVVADAGTSVLVPPGVVHAFTSAGPARFVNVHAPSCDFPEDLRRVDAGEDFDVAAYDVYELD